MMKTFRVLLAGGLAVLAGCGRGPQGTDGGAPRPITLNYANFPPASTFPCVQMEHWKQEVERRTGGRIRINTYPGGTLLGAKDIFDGVVAGTADIGNFAMSYQPGRFPVSEAVDLPHFFPDAARASLVLADLLASFSPDEFKSVKVLTAFTCPPAVVMSAKPVASLADLANLPLRSSGTGAEVMKRLGALPVAMPQSDVPDALQKGVVQGNVSSAEVLKDMNYAAYCPRVFKTDLCVISFAVVMNRSAYEALPADVKAVFDNLYREQAEWTGRYVDGHAEEAIAWARTNRNLTVTVPDEADTATLRATAQPLIDDYVSRMAAKGIDGRAVIDFITTRR